jgi:TRAP-type C4-dicarboxylate transport system permease small subunit
MLKAIESTSRVSAGLAGWLTLPIMITVFLDAFLRGLFGIAVEGVSELNSFLLVAMIYLGLAGTQNARANFQVTLFIERLPERAQRWIGVVLLIVLIAVTSVLCWFCVRAAISSFERSEITYGLIEVPIWPSRAIIAFGFALLVLQFIADVIHLGKGTRRAFDEGQSELPH